MSKSTRFSPEALDAMGLEPDENGGYRKKTIIDSLFQRETLLEKVEKNYGLDKVERTRAYVGVDPGKSGAICVVAGEHREKHLIPLSGKDIDAYELFNIFQDINKRFYPVVILEDVHSIYGTSAGANFTFGFVCGMIRAMVIANKIPFHMVQPKAWQKLIWDSSDMVYKPSKPEQKRKQVDTKATSMNAAKRIFPTTDLRKSDRAKVPHDGVIDGYLLAEYGRRVNF